MTGDTLTRAHGRWREILPLLGIDPRFLVNKHMECPLCGGKDRFRYDDRHGDGDYYCGQCGAGVGIVLLRKLHGWTFKEACDAIDWIIGQCGPANATHVSHSDRRENAADYMRRTMAEATAPAIVAEYLTGRGLSTVPPILLGHRHLAYTDGGKFYGRKPAVLAPINAPDGNLVNCHRIWIDRTLPERKKLMPKSADWTGAACRLFPAVDVLGVAEGVETAIAAYELFHLPTWAAVTAGNLEKFNVPETVKTLVIFGDNDRSYQGQKSAYTLANRLVREIAVEVHIPPSAGTDWLDVLNERGRA